MTFQCNQDQIFDGNELRLSFTEHFQILYLLEKVFILEVRGIDQILVYCVHQLIELLTITKKIVNTFFGCLLLKYVTDMI